MNRSVPTRWRLRICYAKTGRPRFISHLDFVRLFERASRRAGLPLAFSEGFSPAPKISYGWPLQVGMSGLAEYVDVELTQRVPPEKVIESLSRGLPEGIEVRDARYVSPHGPSLMAEFNTGSYVAHCPALGRGLEEWREAARRLLSRTRLEVVRERGGATGGGSGPRAGEVKRKIVDVRPLIRRLEVREVTSNGRAVVFMELELGEKGCGRPDEVVALLGAELTGSGAAAATAADRGGGTGAGAAARAGAGTDQARELSRPEGLTVVRLGLGRAG